MAAPMSAARRIEIYEETIDSAHFRSEIYPKRQPVILHNLDIGVCTKKWEVDFLCENVGSADVRVHVSRTSQMDFINKNFLYRTLPFDELVKRASKTENDEFFICKDEKYYLRALGNDPRTEIADIKRQYPELAEDVKIPDFFPGEKFFSSVFRIGSAGVQLWTHYDVMDNILMQIRGRKRVVLFHPEDVRYLYMKGDKSEVLDIDNPDPVRYPDFHKARRYECILEPGDVIFIPALWLHNVIALDFGVAVNVFWKHLDDRLYDHKDIYGNRDPLPCQRSDELLDKSLLMLKSLPAEYRKFYAQKLQLKIEAYLQNDVEKESEHQTNKNEEKRTRTARDEVLSCLCRAPSHSVKIETILRKTSISETELEEILVDIRQFGFIEYESESVKYIQKPEPDTLNTDDAKTMLEAADVTLTFYGKKYRASAK